ncbi:MAG TPA: tyrosine--tRNA ligase [Candidatus Peribacteraceae bacterium]|nr:tyrosine--tRNA ligase [Candidatus Peribacteraceae bacterium]
MTNEEILTRGVAKVLPQKLAEEKLKSGKKLRVYLGIDPTGTKLHLGHSVPLRKLKQFADAGHHVIFLIGSFTAMIGDPTGKDAMRESLSRRDVEKNFETYKKQAEKILDFSKIDIRYNHEWLEKLHFEQIVDLASNFTVQQMLERDMFEKRLNEGKPVHVHEFFYPLMVGYDSVILDVDFELGGTDQEFNMLAGRTLQTAYGKRDKCILTTRLIEGTDGRKMSKTYDNCIYLTDDANDMYGKVLRIKDELILTYMECTTDIPMDEIKDIEKAMKKGANPKEFKMRLAREIVTMYHGDKAAKQAEEEFQRVFSKGETPEDMPEVKAKKGELLIDLLVREKIVSSKSEARRLIEQKAVTMAGELVTTFDIVAKPGVTKVGKRKFVKVL